MTEEENAAYIKERINEWNETIKQEPSYRKLLKRHETALARCDYVGMAKTCSDMDDYVKNRLRQFVDDYDRQRVYYERTGESLSEKMSDDDKLAFATATDTILLLTDIFETSLMDMNAIIGKVEKGTVIVQFNKMLELLKETHRQMLFMANDSDMGYQTDFADTADKLQELVTNKVRAFIRRRLRARKKDPNATV